MGGRQGSTTSAAPIVSRKLVIRKTAERDLEDAIDYYEANRVGLGDEFLETVQRAFGVILKNPIRYAELEPEVRRYFLKRFPYSIVYAVEERRVVVLGVLHGKRHPDSWRRR